MARERSFKHDTLHVTHYTLHVDMHEHKKIARYASVFGSATFVSRVLGLVRDAISASLFGTSAAMDALVVALTIPNLTRRFFGEGALTAGFVPVFSDNLHRRGKEGALDLANKVISVLLIILIILLCAGWGGLWAMGRFLPLGGRGELIIRLTEITLPYMVFICMVGFFMGVLNTFRHFAVPALAPAMHNVVLIAALLFICPHLGDRAIYGLAFAWLVGGMVQLGAQLPVLRTKGLRFRFCPTLRDQEVKRVIRLTIPGIFGMAIFQINVVVDRFLAIVLGAGPASALYFSNRIIEFPMGIFVIAVATAVLPVMSSQTAAGDMKGMRQSFSHSMRLVFFITIPASVGLIVLHRPIIRLIYEWKVFGVASTDMTASALMFYAIGLAAYAAVRILAQSFYALKDTITPAKVGICAVIVNVLLNLMLMYHLGAGGLALATSIAAFFNAFWLFYLLRKKLGYIDGRRMASSLVRVCAVSLFMGVICYGLHVYCGPRFPANTLGDKLLALGLPLGAGLLAFFVMARIFGLRELEELKSSLWARRST